MAMPANETIPKPLLNVSDECKECIERTQIRYNLNREVWHPRLRSYNHIEFHKSRTYGGFLARLGLFFLEGYEWLNRHYNNLLRWLFPKRDKCYGIPSPYETITGRITFGQKQHDLDVPINNMHVELWGRAFWGGYRKLSEGLTDADGHFSLPYDLHFACNWWMRRVWLGIYHTGHEHYTRREERLPDFTLFKKIPILKGDLVGTEMCLNTIQLFYWEYRLDSTVPRVSIKDHDREAPDHYSPGRLATIERQFVPIELIKIKHLDMIRMAPGKLNYDVIKEDYPENLTVCMEKKRKGVTRGDVWFGQRMMNGMYASDFDRDPRDPELYWIHYHWNSYDKNLHYHAMPDVDIWFRLNEDGVPLPVRITLTGPLRSDETDPRAKRTFTPEDGEKWLAAKRVARVSGSLYTEVAHHFAGTHLNVEQYAIAAFRNLRLNPVAGLLKSYLRSVVLVNHTADRILVGKGYITSACALTPKGINQVVENVLGTHDWKHFRPMKPISKAHVYAHAANLYWNILANYVSEYIDHPPYREKIIEYWHEVYRFSEDLLNHSVPMFLCNYLRSAVLDKSGKPRTGPTVEWFATESRMDLNKERPVVNGVPRALSRITTAAYPEAVTEADLDNLKQACTYIIYQATFGHTWANSKQYDDIGDVLYSSLGLRFGTGPDGVLGPESDTSIAPDLTRATQMMWWSNMLSRTGYGFITTNEDNDVSPHFIEALEKHRADFDALGFNIDTIQSRTNI